MNEPTIPPQFLALIRGFYENLQESLPESLDALGIEIELEGTTVRIYPHPENDDLVIIDVSVMVLDPDDEELKPGRWLAIHELNAATRFTSGWWIVVDSGELLMTRTLPLSEISPEELDSLVVDGLERSESLKKGFSLLGDIETPIQFEDATTEDSNTSMSNSPNFA